MQQASVQEAIRHAEKTECSRTAPILHDSSITKVSRITAPRGELGQEYLAAGVKIGMRLWSIDQPHEGPHTEREYETVGYVIRGEAELHSEGQMLLLKAGDSWVVPPHARHYYKILSQFEAVEATSPPAFVRGRDLLQKGTCTHQQQSTSGAANA